MTQRGAAINLTIHNATDWNDQEKAEIWRAGWAEAVNGALEQQGAAERIDHRSYEQQGIEQIPTIHLGPEAFQMEKRGIRTGRGNINRQIHLDNQMLHQLRARIRKLEHALDEMVAPSNPSHPIPSVNLMETLRTMLDDTNQKSRYKKVADLKIYAKALGFLETNGINDLARLRAKEGEMRNKLNAQTDVLKKNERRKKTLDEYIRNAETYHETLDTYRRYLNMKPKQQAKFFEEHRDNIIRHESAKRYLDGVLNGHTTIPISKWKKELTMLDADHDVLYAEYTLLRSEVQNAESILRSIEQILKEEPIVRTEKEKDVEL